MMLRSSSRAIAAAALCTASLLTGCAGDRQFTPSSGINTHVFEYGKLGPAATDLFRYRRPMVGPGGGCKGVCSFGNITGGGVSATSGGAWEATIVISGIPQNTTVVEWINYPNGTTQSITTNTGSSTQQIEVIYNIPPGSSFTFGVYVPGSDQYQGMFTDTDGTLGQDQYQGGGNDPTCTSNCHPTQ